MAEIWKLRLFSSPNVYKNLTISADEITVYETTGSLRMGDTFLQFCR